MQIRILSPMSFRAKVKIEHIDPQNDCEYNIYVFKRAGKWYWELPINGPIFPVKRLASLQAEVQEYFHKTSVREYPHNEGMWALIGV